MRMQLEKFGNDEIKNLILLFSDSEFTVEFYKNKPDQRIREMCQGLLDKTNNDDLKIGLQLIINQPKYSLSKLYLNSEYKSLLSKIGN